MKGVCSFDLDRCKFGPGSDAVRQILIEWAAIDWFAPPPDLPTLIDPGGQPAEMVGRRRWAKHLERARAFSPENFPANVEIDIARGSMADFSALCERVRSSTTWDWKYGALKKLSRAHTKRFDLRLEKLALVNVDKGEPPHGGDLFFALGDGVVWHGVMPKLELSPWTTDQSEAASWYLGYAQMDTIASIEWQLAEMTERLDNNPFVPLMRCYSAGYYPFSFGPDRVVLFALKAEGLG